MNAPQYGQGQAGGPRVSPDVLPVLARNTDVPLEALGGGSVATSKEKAADQFGDAAGDLATHIENTSIQMRDQADTTMVLNANLKAEKLKNDLQGAGMNLHGPDAVAGAPELSGKLQAGLGDISSTLTTRQQELFQRMANSHVADFDSAMRAHGAQETKQFESQTRQANINNAMSDAANNAYNPQRIQESKQIAQALLDQELAQQGVHPVQMDATGQPIMGPGGQPIVNPDGAAVARSAQLKLTTELHMGVIDARLSDNNPQAAANYFQLNKHEIDPKDWDRINNATKEGVQRGQAQNGADAILAKYLNAGAPGPAGTGGYQDDLAKIKDPQVREATTRLVEQGFSQRQQAVVAAQKNLALDAYGAVAKAPGVDPQMAVPPQTWSAMTDAQKAAANAIPNPPAKSNDAAFAEFNQMRPGDVAALDQHDFMTNYWSKMSKGDQVQAQATWNAAKQVINSPKLVSDTLVNKMATQHFASTNDVDPNLPPSKWDPDKLELHNEFNRDTRNAVNDFETNDLGGKRKATQPEIQSIMDKMTMQSTQAKSGNWWALGMNGSPATQAYQDMDKIPSGDMGQIRSSLRNAGKPVTPQNILKVYNAHQGSRNNGQ